jgi:hypothetical protein
MAAAQFQHSFTLFTEGVSLSQLYGNDIVRRKL